MQKAAGVNPQLDWHCGRSWLNDRVGMGQLLLIPDPRPLDERLGRMDGNWFRDGTGKLVARYDASDDRTRTREGTILGNGDQRLRQLGEDKNPK
jgi:hypothetical protein